MSKYASLVPALTPDDYAALKADIAAIGVQVAVEYDELGEILDGFHRVKACRELGITQWPRITRLDLTEEEKRAHARRLNLARRHLTTAQKRELIESQLKETPTHSNRQIATNLGVDDKTVGAARERLESIAEIPQSEKITRVNGGSYPRKRRYKYKDDSPEGKAAIINAAERIIMNDQRDVDPFQRAAAGASVRKLTTPPKPTEQQQRDHERLFRVLRALENIAAQDITPADWYAALPDYMQDKFREHMKSAAPWLREFLDLWERDYAN